MSSVILQVEDVTKQFPTASAPALMQVSLDLYQGELLGLLGPSGCGKTTLLRLIAGFERPQAGRISLAGRPVATAGQWIPPEQRDVGMVFQDYALFPHLTVAKNVAFGLQQRRKPRSEEPAIVAEAIALVGLQGLENRYPHELSGGQQQRVALARALAPRPALLLLDEPLSNLDVQVRLKLRQEVRDILKATATSAVFVTHDQEEALAMCDRVAVLRQGQIEQCDTPEALYHQPRSRFVAEFVTQANFLPATRQDQVWQTEIGSFAVEDVKIANGLDCDQGEVMIRQEDLVPNSDAAGTVTVRDRHFLGRSYCYWLQTSSGRLLQARTAAGSLSVGESVSCRAATPAVWLFPPEILENC